MEADAEGDLRGLLLEQDPAKDGHMKYAMVIVAFVVLALVYTFGKVNEARSASETKTRLEESLKQLANLHEKLDNTEKQLAETEAELAHLKAQEESAPQS